MNEPSDDVSFILCSYWSEGLHDVSITMVKYVGIAYKCLHFRYFTRYYDTLIFLHKIVKIVFLFNWIGLLINRFLPFYLFKSEILICSFLVYK